MFISRCIYATAALLLTLSVLATDPCAIAIVDPKPGAQVHRDVLVTGNVSKPANGYLWILAHRRGLRGWWPQGGGEADIADGQWEVLVNLGKPGELGSFEVVAVVVDKQSHDELKRWVVEAPKREYPPTSFPTPLEACSLTKIALEKVAD